MVAVLALAAVTIESASAHDKGCDANSVPEAITMDCCGKADEHQVNPEQINQGPNHEYIVSFEGYTCVIPADKPLPSNDPCSHTFFENVWAIAGCNVMALSGTLAVFPAIHPCFNATRKAAFNGDLYFFTRRRWRGQRRAALAHDPQLQRQLAG